MNKKYLILYYICSIMSFILLPVAYLLFKEGLEILGLFLEDFSSNIILLSIFSILNLIIFITITVLLIRKKQFNVKSLLFPISYIVFYIYILIIVLLYNHNVYTNNTHLMYYYLFIMFDYLLFNVYTLLCFKLKENKLINFIKKIKK